MAVVAASGWRRGWLGTVTVVLLGAICAGRGADCWRVLLFWMGGQIIIKAGLFIIAGGKSRGAGGRRWI